MQTNHLTSHFIFKSSYQLLSAIFKKLSRLIVIALLVTVFSGRAFAEESFCAEVTIEIKQELTLERQAFDAHMRINNGVDIFSVEDVRIDIKFSDENGDPVVASADPENTTAAFFIKQDSLTGIDNISGSGVVLPKSSADIHWLIIPAPGSAGQLSTGKLYFVGATLSYTLNGVAKITEITPDFIYVKPTPLLTLDYFLPKDVYADDAFTTQIEPPVPFTLGVRVSNNGESIARDLKINSSQPKIIENELGLLIDFKITSSFVDNESIAPTLLIDFGNIDAQSAKMGRWQMETTLSGEFVAFTAEFSHSDELGGELTSLLEAVNTHELIHDVLVDLPGRDGIEDFFARDGDIYRVYESNTLDTVVNNQSGLSTLSSVGQEGAQHSYSVTAPVTDGFLYVQLPDPQSENKDIIRVIRHDGKILNKANYWLSKTRKPDNSWSYFINLFDQNSKGKYTLVMDDFPAVPHAPVMQFIPDRTVDEGKQIGFIVEASDQDGNIPALSANNLPTGASFTDRGDGVGIFSWTPDFDQAGSYPIEYTASDGVLTTKRTALIIVNDALSNVKNYIVNLEPGFNLFTYPVQIAQQHNSCLGLLNSIGDASVIASISRYNTETRQIDRCEYGSGTDFEIIAGDALNIQMIQQQSIQLNGEVSCPVWFLNPGPNYIGHPAPPVDFSCFSLINLINNGVSNIHKFNRTNGRFESCSWDEVSALARGNDFSILATDGLIINSTIQQLVTLPGCE